jgi:hypothetical protein
MRRETDWRAHQRTWAELIVLDVAPSARVLRPVRALRRADAALWLAGGFVLGISPGMLAILAIIAASLYDTMTEPWEVVAFAIVVGAGLYLATVFIRLLLFAFRR